MYFRVTLLRGWRTLPTSSIGPGHARQTPSESARLDWHSSIGTQQQQQQQQQSNDDDQTIVSRVPASARHSRAAHNNTGVAVVTPAQFAGVNPLVNLGETPLFACLLLA
jgi:hypothetical protein